MKAAVQALAGALGVFERDGARALERPGGRDPDQGSIERPAGKRVPHAERTREVIGVWSALVPREQVPASVHYFES